MEGIICETNSMSAISEVGSASESLVTAHPVGEVAADIENVYKPSPAASFDVDSGFNVRIDLLKPRERKIGRLEVIMEIVFFVFVDLIYSLQAFSTSLVIDDKTVVIGDIIEELNGIFVCAVSFKVLFAASINICAC